jgi:hypothetical protein
MTTLMKRRPLTVAKKEARCARCRGRFTAARSTARFCGGRCRKAYNRDLQARLQAAVGPVEQAAPCGEAPGRTEQGVVLVLNTVSGNRRYEFPAEVRRGSAAGLPRETDREKERLTRRLGVHPADALLAPAQAVVTRAELCQAIGEQYRQSDQEGALEAQA